MGDRPPKRSSAEILREIGTVKTEDGRDVVDFTKFLHLAFPEFPDHPGAYNGAVPLGYPVDQVPSYLRSDPLATTTAKQFYAAYDLTCARHYEMEDDWLATLSDPLYIQFTGEKPVKDPARLITIGNVEHVMLSIADNEYWKKLWPTADDSRCFLSWISHWRREFGKDKKVRQNEKKPIVYEFNAVNRHNWQDVRERVLEYAEYHTWEHEPSYKEQEGERDRIITDLEKRWGASFTNVATLAAGPWREYIGSRTGISFGRDFGAVVYDKEILARRRSGKLEEDETSFHYPE
jgi:hypothetical protein